MTFAKENAAEDGFNRWTINGSAFPMSQGIVPASFLRLVHHAHATPAQFLKDVVVRNRNPEERVRSCHGSASHLR
jgi:hypothetical protein